MNDLWLFRISKNNKTSDMTVNIYSKHKITRRKQKKDKINSRLYEFSLRDELLIFNYWKLNRMLDNWKNRRSDNLSRNLSFFLCPNLQEMIPTSSRQGLAFRTNSQTTDTILMTSEGAERIARFDGVPNLNGVIIVTSKEEASGIRE